MLTMDMMLSTLTPQAAPLLAIGAGALAAMVVFLALALVAVAGAARELARTQPDIPAMDVPVRPAGVRSLAA